MEHNIQPVFSDRSDRIAGCLLGGAMGDALGAPIEFDSWDRIRARFGPEGVTGFSDYQYAGVRGVGLITDDTQMSLFTAEGLLRAYQRQRSRGICDPRTVVYHAYLRWLHTQGEQSLYMEDSQVDDGWLIGIPELHHRRAPGNSCLSALRSGQIGSTGNPINDSKGCGGVMRAAPVGLFGPVSDPFEMGVDIAALTHGHPTGYLAAGCLGQLVRDLLDGTTLPACLEHVLACLENMAGGQECLSALQQGAALWQKGGGEPVTPEQVEQLGAGWVAEEALAIGVFCALAAEDDFALGIRLAVNHSGDSDSTGSIAGNLLGARLGKTAIPPGWLASLELRDVMETVAQDLTTGPEDTSSGWDKYPGW